MAVGIIPNLVVLSWYIRLCTLGSRNSHAFVAGHSSGFCKRNESDSGGASPFRRFEAILTRYLQHPQKQMTTLLNLYKIGLDVCYFLGVHIFRLSTPCKMFHSKITYPFPQKSHECALKLTDLWFTSLLFDLKYKFINGSFAFSPG